MYYSKGWASLNALGVEVWSFGDVCFRGFEGEEGFYFQRPLDVNQALTKARPQPMVGIKVDRHPTSCKELHRMGREFYVSKYHQVKPRSKYFKSRRISKGTAFLAP